MAEYDSRKVKDLLNNPGIIRNRLKLESAITNAKAFLGVQREFSSFDKYIWRFVGGRPIRNRWKSVAEIPSQSDLSNSMSQDLRKRGFRFVGTTICYAFMQAVGMVNDHTVDCFRYWEIG